MNQFVARLATALATHYRVERELGAGGMATVYLAHDLKHEREVAIKVLHPDLGAALGGERFLAEIKTTAKLQHPHILPLLDSGEADGLLYYVMPYVRGETLRARLQRDGALPPAVARTLLRELAEALAHAHDQGIVHRDVKPENILLSAGHVLVADFGIAKATRSSGALTGTGISLGTPAYMAPEQAAGDPQTDHRADLYAWGIVAFELLAGRVPFVGTPQQVMAAHFATPAPDVRSVAADVPADLAELIASCLAKEAASRPATAAAVVMQLGAESAGGRPAAPRTLAPPRRPSRLGALLAAGAVALAAIVYARRDRAPDIATDAAAGARRIAIMPLSALGDSSLVRLGQDLVVTLSTTLNGVGDIRTIDAGTVLMKARTLPSPLPLADARTLAAELGAEQVLTGALTQEGTRVRATVSLASVTRDSVVASASAVAAPTDVALLTDSLTWSVLRQVWERGTAPSPVLSGLTTNSIEALRSFLDGEQAFQRLDFIAATLAYRRAFERDSLFAQAYLRYALAMSWRLEPRDEVAWKRLVALLDRLPERERDWVKAQDTDLPVPAQIARWRDLVARYPDYPPAVMGAGDLIMHLGGWYGVSVAESRPYFERVVSLNPGHADGRSHLQLSEWFSDDPAVRGRAALRRDELATDSTSSITYNGFAMFAQSIAAASRRAPHLALTPNVRAFGRAMAAHGSSAGVAFYAGVLFGRLAPQRYLLETLDSLHAAGIYRGAIEEAVVFGASSSRAARGEWRAAVADAMPLAASTTVAPAMRIHPARLAVFGAYLKTVPVDEAIRAVEKSRDAGGLDTVSLVELEFFDGVVAVLRGNDERLGRSLARLAAYRTRIASHARRALTGFDRAHRGDSTGADSLQVLSEAVFAGLPFLESAEAIGRLVITRRLREQGKPAEVERYLRWTETFPFEPRGMASVIPLYPIVDYEWALALEAAGKPQAAVRHYLSSVENMDRPDPSLAPIVQNAARRLAALDGDVPRRVTR